MGGNGDNTKLSGRAVIYARSASRHWEDRNAIEAQLMRCRRLADALEIQVVQEFTEVSISGLQRDRPELQRLLGYVETNPVDYLVCTDGMRLSRNTRHLQDLTKRLDMLGVQLVMVYACADHHRTALATSRQTAEE